MCSGILPADPDMPYYPAQVVDPSFEILDTSAQIAKTRSAWIDLFPLDGMPKSKVGCFFHKYRLLYLRMMLKFSQFSQVVAVNLAHRPLHERILIAAGKHLHLESRLNTQKRLALLDKSLKKYPYEGPGRWSILWALINSGRCSSSPSTTALRNIPLKPYPCLPPPTMTRCSGRCTGTT